MIRYFRLICPKQANAVRLLSGQLKNCPGFNLSIQDSNRSEADLVSPAHILTGHEVDGRLRWIWFQSDVNFPSSLLRPPAVNRANRGGSDATHHSTQLTPVQSAQKKKFPLLEKVLKEATHLDALASPGVTLMFITSALVSFHFSLDQWTFASTCNGQHRAGSNSMKPNVE